MYMCKSYAHVHVCDIKNAMLLHVNEYNSLIGLTCEFTMIKFGKYELHFKKIRLPSIIENINSNSS